MLVLSQTIGQTPAMCEGSQCHQLDKNDYSLFIKYNIRGTKWIPPFFKLSIGKWKIVLALFQKVRFSSDTIYPPT